MKLRGLIRLVLLAALAGAILWLALHREIIQAAALERELGCFGPRAPILFVLLYALATVLFVLGSVLTVAGGALFGPFWGTLWNLSGATLGATLAFILARYVGSDWVEKRTGERLARLIRGVEEEGWRFVTFVRLERQGGSFFQECRFISAQSKYPTGKSVTPRTAVDKSR